MSTPVNYLSQAAANTDFLNMASSIFAGAPVGSWTRYTEQQTLTGQTMQLNAIDSMAVVETLRGSRRFTQMRAYSVQAPVLLHSTKALPLNATIVNGDKSGTVRRALDVYLQKAANFWDKPVVETLLSNPIGIDGVSLLNNSHPYGPNGGTWDNLTTDALSQNSLEAGYVAMISYRYESGEPGDFKPSGLVAGPANSRDAMDLLGSNRVIPVSNAGVSDAGASVVAAVSQQNWLVGQLDLLIEPRFANGVNDNDWFIMDLTKPGVKPLALGILRGPRGVVIESPDSEPMMNRNEYVYFVDAEAAISGYAPQTIYGRLTEA